MEKRWVVDSDQVGAGHRRKVGVTITRQHEGTLWYGNVLLLDFISVNLLVVILHHAFARHYHWRKLGHGYRECFCTTSYNCMWKFYNYLKIKSFIKKMNILQKKVSLPANPAIPGLCSSTAMSSLLLVIQIKFFLSMLLVTWCLSYTANTTQVKLLLLKSMIIFQLQNKIETC